MRIRVEEKHILAGKRGDHQQCAIALALKDSGLRNPAVGITRAYYNVGWLWWRKRLAFPLPNEAQNFIRDFDRGAAVHPMAFELADTSLE